MTSVLTSSIAISTGEDAWSPSEAQMAAAAFLARYSGRTLESYRFDLRCFFQWAADHDLDVLAATRVHIELYRSGMERRGLAASTIDRRLSTRTSGSLTSTDASQPTRPSTCGGPKCNPQDVCPQRWQV